MEEVFQRLECTVLQRTGTVEVRIYYCERKSALKMEELMYKYRAVHKASEGKDKACLKVDEEVSSGWEGG